MSDELDTTTKTLALVKPQQSLTEFSKERGMLEKFIKSKMRENIDFGVVPGAKRPSLWKAGAEKIAKYYGIHPTFIVLKEIEEWDKGFFYYRMKCELYHTPTGMKVGESDRTCHSFEKSFLFTSDWVNGRKTTRKRSADELMQQQPNVFARAEKRAMVAAVQQATGASEIYDEQTVDENNTEDENPTTLTSRQRKLVRLFAVGGERGFSQENIKKNSKTLFPVASMNDLTEDQLDILIEKLETAWKPVAKGAKPEKISDGNTSSSPDVISESGTKKQDPGEMSPLPDEEESEHSSVPEKNVDRKCAWCKTKPAGTNGFCSPECQDQYYPPKNDGPAPWEKYTKNNHKKKEA